MGAPQEPLLPIQLPPPSLWALGPSQDKVLGVLAVPGLEMDVGEEAGREEAGKMCQFSLLASILGLQGFKALIFFGI